MKLFLIVLACASIVSAIVFLILPSSQAEQLDTNEADVQLYTCGMHPEIISKEPGLCPICHMKLTPKRSAGKSTGTVSVDPTTRQNMGLVTDAAKYQGLSRLIHTFGEVSVPDPNVSSVTLKFDGWIERLFVAEEGERVLKGQPLAEIYSPDLVTAQKELLVALSSESSSTMTRLANAARNRLRNWDISEDQIEQLVQSGEATRILIISSPADGFVQAKHVAEGDRVSARSVLYEIANLDDVWIEAQVYEQDLAYLKMHQLARVSIPSLPGRSFEGQVSYISPILDSQGQTEIRLILKNPDYALKPAMYAEVTLESSLEGNRLVIPRSAVINSGTRQLVYVVTDDDSYEPRSIVTGAVGENDLVEVVEGLAPGDAVVTSGQFLIDSETRLSESMQAMGGHMHGGNEHANDSDHSDPMNSDNEHADHSEHSDHVDTSKTSHPYDIYTCPMPSHFHVLNYGPGKCPECGMDLIPVSETDNAPVYVCPMPECKVATKEPGSCPVCNMRLKEYQPEASHD